MRSLINFQAIIATFALGMLSTSAQENPPKPSTPNPTPTPTQKNTSKNGELKKPLPSTATSGNKYFIEQISQLLAEMEELKGAYNLQIRKMMALENGMKSLRAANENLKRENALRFASNKDIDELAK